jgi:glycosyltransferase involved in cell wall biosynthesis
MQALISIVVPVYQSEKTLHELLHRLASIREKCNLELILVDDGSKDRSWEVISLLKTEYSFLSAIRLSRNYGQHNAILCGMNLSKGEYVVTIDDDLQFAPEDIPVLIDCISSNPYDLVYGMPTQRKDSTVRSLGSRYLNFTSYGNSENQRGGSSFRILKRSLVEKVLSRNMHTGVFLDSVFQWYTTAIGHCQVSHSPRKVGKSGYTFPKLVSLYFSIVVNHSAAPLKAMIWLGILGAFFSFVLSAVFIYRRLIHDVPVGFTATIVAILFTASLILLSLGVIGMYIFRIHQMLLNKPVYEIREVLK